MRLLAKSYGISDVGLAKVCERHKIPRPSLGYWAKKQFGKAPPRPKLPPAHDSMLERVEFMACPGREAFTPRPFFDPEIADMVAAETQKKIIVAEQLRSPHRLVMATKKWFEQDSGWPTSDETAPRGQTERGWTEVLDVDVTQSTLGRALRLVDALIKAFEARGYVIRIQNTNHKRATVISVLGKEFMFRIRG
jgi:hypothetical protein